jgi:DNA-3-methyladenine glycosylase II
LIASNSLDSLAAGREEADGLSDRALIDPLTTIRGIGRWTVEMLLIYSLQRSDVMPADDFGAREGYP